MPVETRPRTSAKPALDLPPPFRLVTLREVGDAFAHATERRGARRAPARWSMSAASISPNSRSCWSRTSRCGPRGARSMPGWPRSPTRSRCMRRRRRPITFDWPDAVRVDGGLVGGGRLAWPQDADENEPPDWLVFGAMIRTVAMGEEEPGLRPLSAALEEEGFDDLGSGRLVESFARHLMVAIDAWQENGFGEVAKSYLARLAPESGVRRDIDDNGDLLVRRMGKVDAERRSLIARARTRRRGSIPRRGGPRR